MPSHLSISINTWTLFDEKGELLTSPSNSPNMTIDVKIRLGFLFASVALTAVALVASAHGISFLPLDEIGGVPH